MPAAVASRARRDPMPPAKKTKLSQDRPNGLAALINGTSDKKPALAAKSSRARNADKEKVDEATAVVGGGRAGHGDVAMEDAPKDIIEISSAEEESEYESEEDDDEAEAANAAETKVAPVSNGHLDDEDRAMEDGTAEPEEQTFGERLQAQEPELSRAPQIVDVEAAFDSANDESRALTTATKRTLTAPSASSLGTVLTQALRTNDQDLLDSCLRVMDIDTIYATVERLPSPLVGNLLQKLAERLHKKPGRAGTLMVWVQWSLAAHGGYLASQPQLVQQLALLNKVLKERASGLQPLLSLKGRLDMLSAQLELRRRNQRRAALNDEEEAVIYVEGQDDISSAEDDEQSDAEAGSLRKRARNASSDDDESSIDEMPTTMEVDEGSDEGSEDSEGMFDDEASETDNDTGDDMSEPLSDDFEEADDGSDSEEESKPTRRSEVGRAGLARRF